MRAQSWKIIWRIFPELAISYINLSDVRMILLHYPVDCWGEFSSSGWFTRCPFHSWMLKLWDRIERLSISLGGEGPLYIKSMKKVVPPHYHILEDKSNHQYFYAWKEVCMPCYNTYLQDMILMNRTFKNSFLGNMPQLHCKFYQGKLETMSILFLLCPQSTAQCVAPCRCSPWRHIWHTFMHRLSGSSWAKVEV